MIAILIGFEYNINKLPGVIIDLYHSYNFCQTFCDKIFVCTDIEYIKDETLLQEAINDKIANDDLLTFYSKLEPLIIINDLLSVLKTILINGKIDKLIIYFSGHGSDGSVILPDNSLLSFDDFKNCILDNISDTEIFWILDCCNPQGLHLPYKLNGNRFTLSPNRFHCVKQKIMLITSAENHEKSIATRSGSLFSRYLFRLLLILNLPFNYQEEQTIPLHKNRNLHRLVGSLTSSIRKFYTGYSQTVSIYSSYIQDPVLPMWIGSSNRYDIMTDLTMNALLIIK